ncbi:permease [Candidatus Micrarchaeota archaeon]|nr:permease [Candidatus Micrarchaeota archaeon]
MDPLESFAYWLIFDALQLQEGTPLGESASFFVYDTLKVFILLLSVIFLVSILRTFITPQKIKKLLGKRKEGLGNVLAALLGIPTPFCSCSAVPLFIGFVESGVPLGITFSFLISAPMVNEVAVALLFGLFGWEITILYVLSGLLIAVVGGVLIGHMNLEKEVEGFVYEVRSKELKEAPMNWDARISFAKSQALEITRKVGLYIVLGVGIGAFIHGYAPQDFLVEIAGSNNLFAVPIAVIMGIPLYSNAAGTIPIVNALIEKGMALGTALAFMMSVIALSLPEMIILRKVLKPKLIAIFVAILAVSITLTGLLFNLIL